MGNSFFHRITNYPNRCFLPIGNYPGLKQLGANVRQAVTDDVIQSNAALATQELLHSPALLTGMDLSVEAEVFGAKIEMSENEVPSVVERLIVHQSQIDYLPSPHAGDGRSSVYLEAVQRLAKVGKDLDLPVFGGMIGPFSLAGRLLGVSQCLELSVTDPEVVIRLIDKIIPFLLEIVSTFSCVGAQGVVLAEPAAGLLSPQALARFSTPFVKTIVEHCQNEQFMIIYHNCGAKAVHFPKIKECGASAYHFGASMDMVRVLEQVDKTILVGGNLDPAEVFVLGNADTIRRKTSDLLTLTGGFPNFFLSSGCEIPPDFDFNNLLVCKEAVQEFNTEL